MPEDQRDFPWPSWSATFDCVPEGVEISTEQRGTFGFCNVEITLPELLCRSDAGTINYDLLNIPNIAFACEVRNRGVDDLPYSAEFCFTLRMSRYDLTDFEWRVIEPLLPNKPRGVPRVDDRRVLNGIFWVLRSGAPWRDLPDRYGPRTTCYNRFVRWRKAGVWDRIMDAVTAAYDGGIQMIDSTSIRAHQQAATAKRGIEIIVSVAPEAGSQPKSMPSSMRKASRSASI